MLPAPMADLRYNSRRFPQGDSGSGQSRDVVKILVYRYQYLTDCVKGLLLIDGVWLCHTLELPETYNGVQNVPLKTCIPPGLYSTERKQSEHVHTTVLELQDVPDRDEVEIHVGNYPVDTEGCMLVGLAWGSTSMIGDSDAAFKLLMNKVYQAWANDETVYVQIKELPEASDV
jgi:Family of unknown function (DUF5675)